MSLKARLVQQATDLGFNRIGIAPAMPSPTLDAYLAWIDHNMHGQMAYLAREDRQARRQNLNVVLEGVQSLLIVALDYTTLVPPDDVINDPARGRIASYAWGADYHDIMTPRLAHLANWLQAQVGQPVQHRVYVDTGAVLERSHAQQAGLGFVGKNTMLIHPQRGSYFFLGEIFTTYRFADAEYDRPHRETMCGHCRRCLVACPTDAFPSPYVLDARRCISYLTIELKNAIPPELRPAMGNWVYGCDVCQIVCPWNRFAVQTLEPSFFPLLIDDFAPRLADLLQLTDAAFTERFSNSPIGRIKRKRMVRNACVAAGNSKQPDLLPYLRPLLHDSSELIREHAEWAIARL